MKVQIRITSKLTVVKHFFPFLSLCGFLGYCEFIVFTKSVDRIFARFVRLGISLAIRCFSMGVNMAFRFATISELRRHFGNKWRSYTKKYQESDEIWNVGVYWSVKIIFLLNLRQNRENVCDKSPKGCPRKHKQGPYQVTFFIKFYKSYFFIFIQLIS